jgi:Rhodanase C-terminal
MILQPFFSLIQLNTHIVHLFMAGGIDKYFKEFPDGGYWKGKNYVFDKRFSHAPAEKEKITTTNANSSQFNEECNTNGIDAMATTTSTTNTDPMSKCEACGKAWDMYRGKRRCPTCGVPSLICKDCWQLDHDNVRKIPPTVRCDLCVEQNVRSKKQLNEKIQSDIDRYEKDSLRKGTLIPVVATTTTTNSGNSNNNNNNNNNPDNVTRLFLKNMCRKKMTEEVLMSTFPGITHIVWRMDHRTSTFLGQGWIEMESPIAASNCMARSGEVVLGRPLYVEYQPPDLKDTWPPRKNCVLR